MVNVEALQLGNVVRVVFGVFSARFGAVVNDVILPHAHVPRVEPIVHVDFAFAQEEVLARSGPSLGFTELGVHQQPTRLDPAHVWLRRVHLVVVQVSQCEGHVVVV